MSGACGDDGSVTAFAEAARSTWMAANRADGQRLQACYELFRSCWRSESGGVDDGARPGYAVVDPFDVCSNHLVAQLAVSSGRADRMIALSVDLTERYPDVLAALVQGRLDQRAAELLVRQMRTVDDAVIDRIQREAVQEYLATIEAGGRLGDGAVRDLIDRAISRHDPDGIDLRRQDAARERGVRISKGQDGMANLQATLAADEMAVVAEQLDHHAAALATTDPVTGDLGLAGQRADALMAMICGDPTSPALTPLAPENQDTPTGPCGSDATAAPAASGAAGRSAPSGSAPVRPRVTVIASDAGGSGPQVAFPRTGESSIQALLAMLTSCDGASIERIDPTLGAHDDPDRSETYRPSAALARAIRLRDGTCRHPGCTVPAEACDIDHVIPFDHSNPAAGGQTCEANHCLFCRKHHRFKTFSDWKYRMRPDGTLTITAPDGTTMRTEPTGPLAAYRRAQQQDEATKWDRQQQRTPDPANDNVAEPDYWHRRAARTRAERRLAERTHQNTRARTQRTTAARTAARHDAEHLAPPTSTIENHLRDLLHPPPF